MLTRALIFGLASAMYTLFEFELDLTISCRKGNLEFGEANDDISNISTRLSALYDCDISNISTRLSALYIHMTVISLI